MSGFIESTMGVDGAKACVKQKARGRSIFLMVGQYAPIVNSDRVFPVMGSVRITLPVALKFLEDAYRNFDDRGAQVRVQWSDRCMFIGSAAG